MIGGNEELNNYILKAQGISRTALNVMAFIGVFIFGWLIVLVFDSLGRAKQGWIYLIPIIIIFAGLRQIEPALGVLALPIYIAAWVHANVILSRYKSAARDRIAEIERQSERGIDAILEKGLLLDKVLRRNQIALDTFTSALQVPGGDPHLLNLAGNAMSANKRYKEATEFFNRALANTKDEALIKLIERNRAFVDKQISR